MNNRFIRVFWSTEEEANPTVVVQEENKPTFEEIKVHLFCSSSHFLL